MKDDVGSQDLIIPEKCFGKTPADRYVDMAGNTYGHLLSLVKKLLGCYYQMLKLVSS